jgi:hypothetical protein
VLPSLCGLPAEAANMTDHLHYVKGLTRFNYWNYPAFNPLLEQRSPPYDLSDDPVTKLETAVHRRLSAKHRDAYKAGDTQAIFTYVKRDVWAFRAPWVVQQIEAWRHEATPESRKKLHRLMRMYTDDRGRDSFPETVRLIKRDQAIFKAIIKLREEEHLPFRSSESSVGSSQSKVGCFETVAKRFSHSVDGVEEIYREYKRKADEIIKGYRRLPASKIRTALEGHVASIGGEKLNWEALERRRQQQAKPRLSSWEEFFQWLDTIAERLDRLLGGKKTRF